MHGSRTGYTKTFPSTNCFQMQLIFGAVAFVLQLPFSIVKDIRRIKQLRYGRRLKGPVLVDVKSFNKAVAGAGIGITTNDAKLPLRIPRDAENKHFLIVGDTGSGKSSIIRQMLYQVDARGDSRHRLRPSLRVREAVLQPASRRHRAQSARRPDALLEPVERAAAQGGSKSTGGFPVSAGGRDEPLLCRGAAEDFRASSQLSADTGGANSMDVRPGRDRSPREGNGILDAYRSEGSAAADRRPRLSQYERRQLPASAEGR